MLKSIVLAGVLGLAGFSTAYAQDNTAVCDDAGIKTLQSSIDLEQSQTNKDKAMKEMMAAQEAMKNNQLDVCAQHMGMATQALKGM